MDALHRGSQKTMDSIRELSSIPSLGWIIGEVNKNVLRVQLSISGIGTGCDFLVIGAVASMHDEKGLTRSQEVRKEGDGV